MANELAATDRERAIIAASRPADAPHFHGARVVGVRPGTPLLHALAVSGRRPIRFEADGLPAGLTLDSDSGILSGILAKPGKHTVAVRARNAFGFASSTLRVEAGSALALSPPMGWNSYDAFGDCVTEAEVLANARWMQDRVQPMGWDLVTVDFRWYDRLADGVRVQDPEGNTLDAFGRMIPAPNRFPSSAGGAGFAPLAAKLHAMGLKLGIHIMRGIPRRAVDANAPIEGTRYHAADAVAPISDPNRECAWNRDMYGVDAGTPAGKAWYAGLARQYAAWGVDFIKCDDMLDLQRGRHYGGAEVEALADGLKRCGRSITLSLSPGPAPVNASRHLQQHASMWRISGDFWDNWPALDRQFDLFADWMPDVAPGSWSDGDTLPLGHICVRNCDVRPARWTRFTRDEQLTMLSLWALASSPLLVGANLPECDEWTAALLTNPAVLAVDQDPVARPARRMRGAPITGEIWRKDLADGSTAYGFFNRTEAPIHVEAPWSWLGYPKPPAVRDLWTGADLGRRPTFAVDLAPHACTLVKTTR
jgi:hypothetical protein